MVRTREFTVATASQLRGSMPSSLQQSLTIETQQHGSADATKETCELKRTPAIRKSVRFTSSTTGGSEKDEISPEQPADADIFTQSPHVSRGSVSSIEFLPHLLPQASLTEPFSVELLQPVTYSPSAPQEIDDRVAAALATGIIRSDTVRHKVGVLEYSNRALPQVPPTSRIVTNEFSIDTDGHKRNLSNSSTSSSSSDQPRRKYAGTCARQIYFTPTDVNSSKTFLSSPLNSPTLPGEHQEDDDDDLPTPRASVSASLTRPPSAISVGLPDNDRISNTAHGKTTAKQTSERNRPAIRITPVQLDELVVALAQSKLLRKHLRKDWFDPEDVPDDESTVSSFSTVSLPTLTSASTLYSQQNDNSSPPLADDELPRYSAAEPSIKPPAGPTLQSAGGIIICDPKIYGTPAKYSSANINIALGSRTFLNTPDGTDVECSLRIEKAPAQNHSIGPNVRVFLQCVNQVVERKSGNKASILSAQIDVTNHVAQAALAELAEGTSLRVEDIAVCPSPTLAPGGQRDSVASGSDRSSCIDWIAVADDLQNRDGVNDMIDTATGVFANLDADTASMSTLSLLSRLSRIADQHHDCLVLKPTSYHPDSAIPHTIKIPHCSRRLYEDWYTDPRGSQAGERVGESEAARLFQRGVVSSVAKRAGEHDAFQIEVFWERAGRVRQVLRVVPMEGAEGERIWCCFVLGEWDLSP